MDCHLKFVILFWFWDSITRIAAKVTTPSFYTTNLNKRTHVAQVAYPAMQGWCYAMKTLIPALVQKLFELHILHCVIFCLQVPTAKGETAPQVSSRAGVPSVPRHRHKERGANPKLQPGLSVCWQKRLKIRQGRVFLTAVILLAPLHRQVAPSQHHAPIPSADCEAVHWF